MNSEIAADLQMNSLNELAPFYNRCIQAAYSPGSFFASATRR